MIDFASFYQLLATDRLSRWLTVLPAQLHAWQHDQLHGDLPRWQRVLAKLEGYQARHVDLKHSVTLGQPEELPVGERSKLENLLQHLHPWRKGPYHLFGIHIDTEWRSDWKWDRVLPHLSPLKGRYVLDVGCGSGYHMWRMLGEEARLVVGIDPSPLFLCQFSAIKQLAGRPDNIHFLPLGIEQLPKLERFDTVFSMGVLYHRRSPIDHLFQLRDQLRDGGELVLETLVIDGGPEDVLVPGNGRHDEQAVEQVGDGDLIGGQPDWGETGQQLDCQIGIVLFQHIKVFSFEWNRHVRCPSGPGPARRKSSAHLQWVSMVGCPHRGSVRCAHERNRFQERRPRRDRDPGGRQ